MVSREEVESVHEEILTDFIKGAQGLIGMVLIGIREDDADTTAIEIRSGARVKDIYRACSAMLEALLEGGENGVRITNAEEAKAVAALADVLLMMAGDKPDDLEKVSFEELRPGFSNTKKH